MSRARILVIDDDPVFRRILVMLLSETFTVVIAPGGMEGLQAAIQEPPHVVLIDVQMPKWDGLQTLKAFRSHASLQRIPAIMLTGDASRATVVAAIDAGATDYVIKTNIAKDELIRKVRRALDFRGSEPVPVLDEVEDRPAQGSPKAALQSVLDSWE